MAASFLEFPAGSRLFTSLFEVCNGFRNFIRRLPVPGDFGIGRVVVKCLLEQFGHGAMQLPPLGEQHQGIGAVMGGGVAETEVRRSRSRHEDKAMAGQHIEMSQQGVTIMRFGIDRRQHIEGKAPANDAGDLDGQLGRRRQPVNQQVALALWFGGLDGANLIFAQRAKGTEDNDRF